MSHSWRGFTTTTVQPCRSISPVHGWLLASWCLRHWGNPLWLTAVICDQQFLLLYTRLAARVCLKCPNVTISSITHTNVIRGREKKPTNNNKNSTQMSKNNVINVKIPEADSWSWLTLRAPTTVSGFERHVIFLKIAKNSQFVMARSWEKTEINYDFQMSDSL